MQARTFPHNGMVNCWSDCRIQNAGDAFGTAGFEVFRAAFTDGSGGEIGPQEADPNQTSPLGGHGYVRTQPPELLLKALLHRDCTANVPVERLISAEAPWPEEIQAHLSPFPAPPESSQPPWGNWSVIVSAISCPETIVMPALGPSPLKLAPQLAPASVMYGRLV